MKASLKKRFPAALGWCSEHLGFLSQESILLPAHLPILGPQLRLEPGTLRLLGQLPTGPLVKLLMRQQMVVGIFWCGYGHQWAPGHSSHMWLGHNMTDPVSNWSCWRKQQAARRCTGLWAVTFWAWNVWACSCSIFSRDCVGSNSKLGKNQSKRMRRGKCIFYLIYCRNMIDFQMMLNLNKNIKSLHFFLTNERITFVTFYVPFSILLRYLIRYIM